MAATHTKNASQDAPVGSVPLSGFHGPYAYGLANWRAGSSIGNGAGGAVTAIQRFGSALNTNVHFHTSVVQGVFVDGADGELRFVPSPKPSDLYAARLEKGGPLHAHDEGFDLHAAVVAVPAGDRKRLEHLCRYILRPPLAQERLERTPEGKVLLRLRRTWSDGTRAIRSEPIELLERLAAMIPKPRINLLVYHGVFGPHARRRRAAVITCEPGGVRGTSRQEGAGRGGAKSVAVPLGPPWCHPGNIY